MQSKPALKRFSHRGVAMLAVCLFGLVFSMISTACNAQTPVAFPLDRRTFGQFDFRASEATYRLSGDTATITVEFEIRTDRAGPLLFSTMRPTLRSGVRTYAPKGGPVVGTRYNSFSSNEGLLFRANPGTSVSSYAQLSWTFEVPVEVVRPGLQVTFEYRNPLPGQSDGSFSVAMPGTPSPPSSEPSPSPSAALRFTLPTSDRFHVPRGAIPFIPDTLLTYTGPTSEMQPQGSWGLRLDSVTYARSGVVRVNLAVQNYTDARAVPAWSQIRGSLFTTAPNAAFPHQRSFATVNNVAVPDDAQMPVLGYFYLSLEFNIRPKRPSGRCRDWTSSSPAAKGEC